MKYKEVETLEDPDGVVVVITESEHSGNLSFRIQKQFELRGETKVTSYLGRRHIPAIRRLCQQLEDRLLAHADRVMSEQARP